jgi:predicted nucleic acid-binding Zn ribbon protein
MGFNSLERVLESLRILERSPTQQQLQILNKSWSELLGPFADYSCPITIERHTLYIATLSPTLAQELTLQSMDILNKVNQLLPTPVEKIHFSTAQWQKKSLSVIQPDQTESLHPSLIPRQLTNTSEKLMKTTSKHALEQFERWRHILQQRSHDLPLCPQCQAPTPPGELERWSVCAICLGQNQQKQAKITNLIDSEIDF